MWQGYRSWRPTLRTYPCEHVRSKEVILKRLTNLTKISFSMEPHDSRSSLHIAATDDSDIVTKLLAVLLLKGETFESFSGNKKLADATKSRCGTKYTFGWSATILLNLPHNGKSTHLPWSQSAFIDLIVAAHTLFTSLSFLRSSSCSWLGAAFSE